jgi:acetolactate synthase-1/2/3 large subunit
MQTNGAGLIVRLLERQGITTIPGIPGGASLPLYDALHGSAIHHVLARHEQGAGFIAQGMARTTGAAAVCLGTSGPGATNLLTAIADAKLDSIPLVAITGQVPRAMIGTDAFQEIDTYGLTIPITKHNYLVSSARELLRVVPEAFRIATSDRPGPVVIDVPKDVQLEPITVDAWPEPGRATAAMPCPAADARRAVALLEAARRPVLLVGAGVLAAGASDLVRQLAEAGSIPVAATLLGLGVMPTHHPLFLGMVGMHAARATNLILEECDLLVGLGIRFDDRATGKAAEFCPGARIIHVDVDASELGKIKTPTLGIRADVGEALRAFLADVTARRRPTWSARVAALRAAHPLAMPGMDDVRRPYGIVRAVAALAGDDAIVTSDVGQHQMWVAQAFPFTRPRQWLTSGGLGTMGFGLPAAIGAALACRDRRVVCFTGDGSLLMNIQELATAVEEETRITVILLDNAHLGLVRQQQELFYGGRFHGSRFHAAPDFAAIARGFGMEACDLETAADAPAALAHAFASEGPYLVRVPIAAEANVYPMVRPGAANREMIDHNLPHDAATEEECDAADAM